MATGNRRDAVPRAIAFFNNLSFGGGAKTATTTSVDDLKYVQIIISRIGVHTTYNQTIKFASQGGLPRMHTLKMQNTVVDIFKS